ncbi:MAG: NADAR family protein [Pseudomonadota bacterium]|nr:NADAR family protein [Pseudomonadota bacterium]
MQDQIHLTHLQQRAHDQSLRYLYFWGHTQKGTAISKACLSQWYPAAFTVDGVTYPTAEHWMMVGKARLFDSTWVKRIIANPDPAAAKAFGRKIKNFDQSVWLQHRFELVVQGNLAKFSQNAALKEFLLATGDQVLVEASPVDQVWGIGLAADDPSAATPAEWRGLNLLGFALMRVREQLELCST